MHWSAVNYCRVFSRFLQKARLFNMLEGVSGKDIAASQGGEKKGEVFQFVAEVHAAKAIEQILYHRVHKIQTESHRTKLPERSQGEKFVENASFGVEDAKNQKSGEEPVIAEILLTVNRLLVDDMASRKQNIKDDNGQPERRC